MVILLKRNAIEKENPENLKINLKREKSKMFV
jgi:hypothetical protein